MAKKNYIYSFLACNRVVIDFNLYFFSGQFVKPPAISIRNIQSYFIYLIIPNILERLRVPNILQVNQF